MYPSINDVLMKGGNVYALNIYIWFMTHESTARSLAVCFMLY